MKRLVTLLLAGLFLLGLSVTSMAHTPVINRRQYHEQQRIRQGIRSGELTRVEAARLEAEQSRIRLDEARARQDGRVTCRERTRINRELNRASRNIYRQTHDRQDRIP
jgi:hypothetical protein